ncbi:MAG: OmpA family protein [Bacteroidota bacterium]|nr:OmpA family protein [Bacteroidota bacterium]
MKRIVLLCSIVGALSLTSCGAKKKIAELESKNKEIQDKLNSATLKLNTCLAEKKGLEDQVGILKSDKQHLNEQLKNHDVLSVKRAENEEKFLESLKEKDLRINRLQDALTKKDSVNFALVSSLKKEVGVNDPDIEVNVEKGVVFISISDKMLFKSGSYEVTPKAKEVLAKVAKVINSKPDFECMIEGHTDNVPFRSNGVLLDNWDLSVKRSTSIIRVLQTLGVNPAQLIAAGRAEYVPLVENNTSENRSVNRRTRVVVLPKIDQFYNMIEQEMKNLSK